jgi:hypothetical protein
MLRSLIGRVLIAPLLLNGLWIVCNDAPSAESVPLSKEAECARICLLKLQASGERFCLILPGASKTSISVIDFGVAVVPLKIQLQCNEAAEPYVSTFSPSYSNPSLANHTPPPRV